MAYYRIRFTAWRDSAAEPYQAAHKRVGSLGYQITEHGALIGLKDDSGADLPAGAAYCYEIIDTAPPAPAFSLAGAALREGAARELRAFRKLAKTDPVSALLKKEKLL